MNRNHYFERNVSDLINKFEIRGSNMPSPSARRQFPENNEDLYYVDGIIPPSSGDIHYRRQFKRHDSLLSEDSDIYEEKSRHKLIVFLSRICGIFDILSYIPLPRISVTGMGILSLIAIFICPRLLGQTLLYPGFRLTFGTLYPAYSSYKAVRTKNVKEYVSWQ